MKSTILKKMSAIENANYRGKSGEVVSIPLVGVAVHNGTTFRGTVVRTSIQVNDNLFRNGNWSVQQNGNEWLGNSDPNNYIVDGWWVSHNGGSTSNVAIDTSGDLLLNVTSGGLSSSYSQLTQVIANPADYSNRVMTLSFIASSNQAESIAVEATTTGSSPKFISRVDLTSTKKLYTLTFNAPQYVESTPTTDKFYIKLWLEAGDDWNDRTGGILPASHAITIESIKLEFGDEATEHAFIKSEEELKVMTYFEKSVDGAAPVLMSSVRESPSVDSVVCNINYRRTKWKDPAVSFSTAFTSSDNLYNNGRGGFQLLSTWDGVNSISRLISFEANAELEP